MIRAMYAEIFAVFSAYKPEFLKLVLALHCMLTQFCNLDFLNNIII